ncbi:hypothetical protein ACTMU2_41580 [Cupriavidus basilensis]
MPTTLIFHGFWRADLADSWNQLNHILKNIAILGGMLVRLRDRVITRA